MGHQHDLLGQCEQQRRHPLGVAQVEQGGRLVADQDRGLGDEHRCQCQQLLLAARQQVCGMVGVARQPEPVEHLGDPSLAFETAQTLTAQRELDVLAHRRHHDLRVRVGEHEAHRPAYVGAVLAGIAPVDPHRAFGRQDQPVEGASQCRLARPVGADDRDPLLAQGKRHIAQHGALAVPVGDRVDPDHPTRSTSIATPWPPPIAQVARPQRGPSWRTIREKSRTTSSAPLAPHG